ncbi:tRNA(Ile)-lysidine synthase-like isoform X2 [Hibiscus syriacus]|uniref:tRNA(Ile)-lysidine synthase-like isoform X2 n=1 Tax=Hibiscus syriacus TaxID=106335 RepID=UPI0019219082|nr:tRNA(Ile)-lysidine synthase-like isoform X2 [Hibiscus syriacus]
MQMTRLSYLFLDHLVIVGSLAGMTFTSQLFSSHTSFFNKDWINHSILLVRPLLEFSKEDMYKICQGSNRDWVEDPTNRSPLFARNRIQMSLENLLSGTYKSELQAVISACRKTRIFVDQICSNLIKQTDTVMDVLLLQYIRTIPCKLLVATLSGSWV